MSLTNLQDGKFDFRFTTFSSLRAFQTLGDERPDVTVRYPDDGLGIGAIRMGAAVWCEFVQRIGKATGMGEETIRYSEDVPSPAGLSCVGSTAVCSIKNLSSLAGHCELMDSDESAGRPAAHVTVRGTN